MRQTLRVILIAGVVITMALGVTLEFANADALKSMIAGAKKEKSLRATLTTRITKETVKQLQDTFNQRYGLDIEIIPNLTGRYSVKAKQVVKQYREGAKPDFDVMVLNESAFANLANAEALEQIDDWKDLLPDGADPSVSPTPIAGLGFKSFDFYYGYSYKSDKVNTQMMPLSIKDLGDASLNGNVAVSLYMTNITYAVMKYSPDELLAISESWGQNNVQKVHPRKMAKQVAMGKFAVGGFQTVEQYLGAKAQSANYEMGFFSDLVPRGVLLHAVPKGAESPNAAKLFALWMTGPEALKICTTGTYLGNILNQRNSKAITLAEQLMKKQNVKAISFFDSEENYKKLVWLGSADGQQFTKRFGGVMKKSAK